jgi:hypothetical protein
MTTFYFHPKISFKKFKMINDALYKGTGPDIVMVNGDKIMWKMLKERKINIGVDTKRYSKKYYDPVFLSIKDVPRKATIIK